MLSDYRLSNSSNSKAVRDFAKCGFLIGWRKQTLRWSDVTGDVIYVRAEHSKNRKPESLPLEGELKEIIERRRAAAVWQCKDGQGHFSEYVFHDQGQPVGDSGRPGQQPAVWLESASGFARSAASTWTTNTNALNAGVNGSVRI